VILRGLLRPANLDGSPTGDDLDRWLNDLGRLLDLVRAVNDEPNVFPTSLTGWRLLLVARAR
jgi:hypothetical protein